MQEIIEGIRVIKMYVWEASFARVISQLRLEGTPIIFNQKMTSLRSLRFIK